MTCILAIIKDGVGYMAGDMCASIGDDEKLATNPKIFSNNGVLLGFCGSWRVINAMYHELSLKKVINMSYNVEQFCFNLTTHMMQVAEAHKFLKIVEGEAYLPGASQALVVYKDSIIEIGSDFSYIIHNNNYAAIGMPDVALGILTTMKQSSNPQKIIKKAMKEASKNSAGVSEDYYELSEDQ